MGEETSKWNIRRLLQNLTEAQNLWKHSDFLPKCSQSAWT